VFVVDSFDSHACLPA